MSPLPPKIERSHFCHKEHLAAGGDSHGPPPMWIPTRGLPRTDSTARTPLHELSHPLP